jgi:hypothetical protein
MALCQSANFPRGPKDQTKQKFHLTNQNYENHRIKPWLAAKNVYIYVYMVVLLVGFW